ncbi:Hypothetical protein (plasmid) [Pseudomonas putida]|uniref:Uncharacterized protein n=4 Tax=Pseudomonas TaxID=286 RepID=A0A1X1A0W0_PSEPU|nr:hypothetical protein B7H18_09245 [Pseudomonas putida]PLP92216.1 hypothetical protein CX682_09725 [Pseudomonas sp. FFUP_PS_41]QDQ70476.1 hypothetical protein pJBCL41_00067 [Pseudomonas sp.]ORL58685.1 hypothetical protein B7H17_24450 [Pseudomonas putida]ORL65564.1 hypothetical protein B7H19_22715 [Pseudomonas putida]
MKSLLPLSLALMLASTGAAAALPDGNPAEVCAYMTSEGLIAGEWHVRSPGEAGCSTPPKEIGGGSPPNNLVYLADGNETAAHTLRLALNLNQPQAPAMGLQLLLQASHSLSLRVTGKRLPPQISAAITSRLGNASATVGQVNISVVRTDWATGDGYNLQVRFE